MTLQLQPMQHCLHHQCLLSMLVLLISVSLKIYKINDLKIWLFDCFVQSFCCWSNCCCCSSNSFSCCAISAKRCSSSAFVRNASLMIATNFGAFFSANAKTSRPASFTTSGFAPRSINKRTNAEEKKTTKFCSFRKENCFLFFVVCCYHMLHCWLELRNAVASLCASLANRLRHLDRVALSGKPAGWTDTLCAPDWRQTLVPAYWPRSDARRQTASAHRRNQIWWHDDTDSNSLEHHYRCVCFTKNTWKLSIFFQNKII